MFEYANGGVLIMGSAVTFLLLFATMLAIGKAEHEGRKSYAYIFGMIGVVISVWMMINEGRSSKESALASYAKFEKQGEIICNSIGNKYIVSQSRGWKRYNDGFTKDDILINVRWCSEEE